MIYRYRTDSHFPYGKSDHSVNREAKIVRKMGEKQDRKINQVIEIFQLINTRT